MRRNIRMRVNTNTRSRCEECGTVWNHTGEMYDLLVFGEIHQICRLCSEMLFQKTLRAGCAYNGKVKSKEDLKRAEKEAHKNRETG